MRLQLSFIFILLMAFAGSCYAQNFISVRKNNRPHSQYFPGKEITIIYYNGIFKQKITGNIDSIGNEIIYLQGRKIYVEDITAIHVYRSHFNYLPNGIKLTAAGLIFTAMPITQGYSFGEAPSFYIFSGLITTAGIGLILRYRQTIHIGGRNKILIISPI